jgi:metal-dependent amidase/aminoacylase/carboxypeptidase family protein
MSRSVVSQNGYSFFGRNSTIWWYFRHSTAGGARILFSESKRIAQGAAIMANCEFDVDVRSAVRPV